MKLPKARDGRIDTRKVVEYLLNSSHPDNGGKARFFAELGFSATDADAFVAALRTAAAAGEVVDHVVSRHGDKYVVDGWVQGAAPRALTRIVRMVWIVEAGSDAPRLVTAYPVPRGDRA